MSTLTPEQYTTLCAWLKDNAPEDINRAFSQLEIFYLRAMWQSYEVNHNVSEPYFAPPATPAPPDPLITPERFTGISSIGYPLGITPGWQIILFIAGVLILAVACSLGLSVM